MDGIIQNKFPTTGKWFNLAYFYCLRSFFTGSWQHHHFLIFFKLCRITQLQSVSRTEVSGANQANTNTVVIGDDVCFVANAIGKSHCYRLSFGDNIASSCNQPTGVQNNPCAKTVGSKRRFCSCTFANSCLYCHH